MNEIKSAKFETFIEDIDAFIRSMNSGSNNTALALIYDYEKCNEYAKTIMDKTTLNFRWVGFLSSSSWHEAYPNYNSFNGPKETIYAAKKLVELCRRDDYLEEGYKFIFWALMILAVDKTDAEEHLSLICDFAKMLNITDDEFEDIIQVVKLVYNATTTEYIFKSEKTTAIFGSLFNLYGVKNAE